MRVLRLPFATATLLAILTVHSLAANVKVVANDSVKADSISAKELRTIFLAESIRLKDGSHVEPVFERDGAVHETFLKDYLKETNASLRSHYDQLVFTGKASMPKSFSSDADVVAYVARTRGAIGYVDASASSDGVKVLDVPLEGGASDRRLITRVEPEVPDILRQKNIGGVVRLQLTISPQGSVEAVSVLGGNPILGEAAMQAIKQWVYSPGPAKTVMQITVPFDAH